MNRIELLIASPEGKQVEFKRDLSSPKPIAKTIVAFANSAGGTLIIGVTDSKEVIGIENPFDEEERICNLLADLVSPRIVPNIEMVTIDQKVILVVEVYLSGSRPHYISTVGLENGVFVRLGSTNRQADQQLVAEIQRSVEGVSYDALPMPELTIDDIDMNELQTLFKGKREINEKTLLTLRLLTTYQGRLVPTKGVMLLFGKNRELYFPDVWIQCGRFLGTDKTEIFDSQEIHTSLPKSYHEIVLFLKKHAMRSADFSTGAERIDRWSIPLVILREVIINALVHTDYSQRGAPIRVSFFDDRIEIENPGILVPGMTIEDMKEGLSKVRNQVISRIFRELKLVELWGSGVQRIFSEAKKLGLPEPIVSEIGMRVRVIIPFEKTFSVEDAQTAKQVTMGVTMEVTMEVKKLLQIMQGEMTRQVLQGVMLLKNDEHFRKHYLLPALEAGVIERTIPDKPNSRLQKYRLTAAGKKALQHLQSERGEK